METNNEKQSRGRKKEQFDITSHGGLLFVVIIGIAVMLVALNYVFQHSGTLRQSLRKTERINKAIEEAGGDPTGDRLLRTLIEADSAIVDEINNIKNEEGMPDQVFVRDIPAKDNIAVHVMNEFRGVEEKTYNRLRSQISVSGPWSYEPQGLKENGNIMATYSPQRDRIRDMLDKPDVRFEQDMIGTENGLVPDDKNAETDWFYVTLEECEIAKSLENKDMVGAMKSLTYILRFAELVSHSKFVVMRKQGADIRENALRILQTMVYDPKFGSVETKAMNDLLISQLQKWPNDRKCWIGDRASSLRVYDLLRRGRVSEALEPEDLDELYRLNVLGEVRDTSVRGKKQETSMEAKIAFFKTSDIDKDQIQYLKAMRTVVDSCSKPFYQRLPILDEIEDHFKKLQGSKEYVAIAPILLRYIREGMQFQAEDKARVEAWVLALATKRKFTVKPGTLDPVRGKPYQVSRIATPEGSLIVVSYGGGTNKVEIPE